jgi:hypothetical protein
MTEPAWLTHLVDQRMALINDKATPLLPEHALVMTPLTEPPEGATEAQYRRWDRTCDCCQTFCPPGKDFYTGHLVRELSDGRPVYMTFGVCKRHRF